MRVHRAPPETAAAACGGLGFSSGFFSPGFFSSGFFFSGFFSADFFSFSISAFFSFSRAARSAMSRCAVEIDAAIDQGLLHDGVGAERIVIVDDQVGILADVDGADALVDAQLHRGIQRDELERFVVREAAVLHASWRLPD